MKRDLINEMTGLFKIALVFKKGFPAGGLASNPRVTSKARNGLGCAEKSIPRKQAILKEPCPPRRIWLLFRQGKSDKIKLQEHCTKFIRILSGQQ